MPPAQLRRLLAGKGKLYSEELGIDLRSGRPGEIFRWFFASVLFGKPIQESCVARTYRVFEDARMIEPRRLAGARWDRLVHLLDEGAYTRYDFSTADKLLAVMPALVERYGGDLGRLHAAATDSADLEARLKALGKGIGDVTASIFLREMQDIWPKARPRPTPLELLAARKLGIRDIRAYWQRNKVRGYTLANFETALARYGKELRRRRARPR